METRERAVSEYLVPPTVVPPPEFSLGSFGCRAVGVGVEQR